MDDINVFTGEAVFIAVRRSPYTQRAVADLVGMSQSSWLRRMKGERPFRVHELVQIARVLGVSAGDIVAEVEGRAA